MSEGASEVEDLDDSSSINVELESEETLSTVSSSTCNMIEIGSNIYQNVQPLHIVQQLLRREMGVAANQSISPPMKIFSLSKILPSRVLRGQVFMGMSRCGRFLITYSSYSVPYAEDWFGYSYKYVLHWWKFAYDKPAKEIHSVPLFGSARVLGPLQIFICQWPQYSDKILVYGLMRDVGNGEIGVVPMNQRAYVTITAVPTTRRCSDCITKVEDFESSFSGRYCIVHSFTVHSSFDIAVPYPEFTPKINLKFEDFSVFNTNNALHALRVTISESETLSENQPDVEEFSNLSVQVAPSPSPPRPSQSRLQELIIRDFTDDASLTPKRIVEDSCLSPPLPTRLKVFTDLESPQSSNADAMRRTEQDCAFLAPRMFLKVKKCGMKRLGFRPIFSRRKPAMGLFMETRKSSPYEFVDDSPSEVEKLSQFRRKRLADKTYEFQDCDSENIIPFSQARVRPADGHSDDEPQFNVLRPINRNPVSRTRLQRIPEKAEAPKMSLEANVTQTELDVSFNDVIVHDLSGRYDDCTPEDIVRLQTGLRRLAHCFRGTATKYTRRFHEDDNRAPVTAAYLEDDDTSAAAGYHTALNLEVHGPAYSPLHMTTNCKVNEKVVKVEQQSLDIEAICHSVATSLCMVDNKTFTFCNDYDVEVLDVCPHSGDVLVLLMMRIDGCEGKREEGSSSIEQFETSVTLVWNLINADYRVTMVVPPQRMDWDGRATWNPARQASRKFRASLPPDVTWSEPAVRVCSNNSYLKGVSLSQIQDHENRVQFVL